MRDGIIEVYGASLKVGDCLVGNPELYISDLRPYNGTSADQFPNGAQVAETPYGDVFVANNEKYAIYV
jgi:hypothetical protein